MLGTEIDYPVPRVLIKLLFPQFETEFNRIQPRSRNEAQTNEVQTSQYLN